MKQLKIALKFILNLIIIAAIGYPIFLVYYAGADQWQALTQGWMFIIYAFVIYIFGITIIENSFTNE